MPSVDRVESSSESEVLARFTPTLFQRQQSVRQAGFSHLIVGPGDDAAVLDLRGGQTVVTTDTQVENQDFRWRWPSGLTTTGYDIGWKATTQNLADVAAMGAQPVSMVVSISCPKSSPVQFFEDFAQGMVDACAALGAEACTVAGGDLGTSTELSVTVTALGLTPQPVLRSGAHAGDQVAIAGALGTAAAGLALLETERLPDLEEPALACIAAQQRPQSPLKAGEKARLAGATAMLDVSDGPLKDASRIADASGITIDFETESLRRFITPLENTASLLSNSPEHLALEWVLTGGENHGLLATFPADAELPTEFTRIGTCREKLDSAVTVDGVSVESKGWDHFGQSMVEDLAD